MDHENAQYEKPDYYDHYTYHLLKTITIVPLCIRNLAPMKFMVGVEWRQSDHKQQSQSLHSC